MEKYYDIKVSEMTSFQKEGHSTRQIFFVMTEAFAGMGRRS